MSIVGIEFGTGHVRILALTQKRKSWTLTTFVERAIPLTADTEGFPQGPLVEAISEAFDKHKLPRDQVALSLPAQRCTFRYFPVDFTADEAIKKIIKYEAENHLPTTSIEDVIVNYYKLSTEKERSHLLVSIVEKKLIRSALQVLEACRIDPLTIDIDLLASLNAYRRCKLFEDKPRVLLVEVGEHSSNLGLVVDGQLQFLRSVKLGLAAMQANGAALELGEDPLENLDLSGDLKLNVADLEKDLVIAISSLEETPSRETRKGGKDPTQEALAALEKKRKERFFERLGGELRRTILAARKGAPELVYLTGPGSLVDEVRESLAERLGVPVETPRFVDLLPHSLSGRELESANACLPSALGVGLKLLGLDASGAELRKEEFRFAKKFEQLQGALVAALVLLFGISLLACWHLQRLLRHSHESYRHVLNAASQIWAQHLEGDPGPVVKNVPADRQVARLLQDLVDKFEKQGGKGTGVTPVRPALELWRELSAALEPWTREADERFSLRQLRIDEYTTVLLGSAKDKQTAVSFEGAVDRFAQAREKLMERPKKQELRQDAKTGAWEFHITINLRKQP